MRTTLQITSINSNRSSFLSLTSLKCVIFFLLFPCSLWSMEDAKPLKPSEEMHHMLDKVHNQWLKKNPGIWTSDYESFDIVWVARLTGLRSKVSYKRKIRETPDGTYLTTEVWNIHPDDLEAFMLHWGYTHITSWNQIRAHSGQQTVFASPKEGLICIWRFYPNFKRAWKSRPYSLSKLAKKEPAEPSPEKFKKSRDFISDVLLEEVLDRDGLGVSLSKTWHFKEEVSRFSGKLRFQRKIRLNFNGLYSVFDTYHIGTEGLLGNIIEKTQSNFYSEIGPFLGISKEIIVVKSGYESWHKALFARPFNPKNLPVNREKLKKLPDGIRVIFPHKATLALVTKTKFNYVKDSDITQTLRAGASVRGSVMVSVTKEGNFIILKIGGRLEKLLEAYFATRPDFDGILDPLRLLFGSLIRFRFEGGKGKRVLLEKRIDLNSEEELMLLTSAMKRGLLLRGLGFGFRTALYFIFHPNNEQPHLYYQQKIPEINWDQAVISNYRYRDKYAKAGSRPLAVRSSMESIGDEWRTLDYQSNKERSGYTFIANTNRHLRAGSRSRTRDLQVNLIKADSYAGDAYATIIDLTTEARCSRKKLMKFKDKMRDQHHIDLTISENTIQTVEKNEARMGYKLTVSLEELLQLQKSGTLNTIFKHHPELQTWSKKHRLLGFKFHQFMNEDHNFTKGKTLYSMLKRNLPLTPILNALPESAYRLEWLLESPSEGALIKGSRGAAKISREQLNTWQWWNEKRMFEDIFVDVSLTQD